MDINARVIELNKERMSAIDKERKLVDDTVGKERTAEQEAELTRIGADIARIEAEVRTLVATETRNKEYEQIRSANESLFGEPQIDRMVRTENDQIRAWLRNSVDANGDKVNYRVNLTQAAKERDLIRRGAGAEELRALNYQTSTGSLVVPTTMARELYSYLEASIAAFRIGARQLQTATGETILIPKLGAHAIAVGSIPQGTAVGGTDPTFAQVRLDAYQYGELVAISNRMLRDTAFDIGSWLAEELGYSTGRKADSELIAGLGVGVPTGMTVLAGAGTNAPVKTGGSLITPSYEVLIDTIYSVNDAYRSMGAAWLMKDSSAGTLRKLRDGAGGTVGAVLWEPSLTNGIQNGQPDRFLGYPVYTDGNCASQGSNATVVTFGWFGEYVLRTVGDFQIESSPHLYFDKDQTAFRGLLELDGDHRDVGALNNLVQNA